MVDITLERLRNQILQCELCQASLPLPAKPILQVHEQAKILIAGQAPSLNTHHKGIPFDDVSGDRLRNWLGVSREQFYDPRLFAIVPMGFCFPGNRETNGKKTGDKPPIRACAQTWHSDLLKRLTHVQLTIMLGQYAIDYHLGTHPKLSVSQAVEQWQTYWPLKLALPHPSPRNNLWLKQHPEFEAKQLPMLKQRVARLITNQ